MIMRRDPIESHATAASNVKLELSELNKISLYRQSLIMRIMTNFGGLGEKPAPVTSLYHKSHMELLGIKFLPLL
jgi:hypothetical protein